MLKHHPRSLRWRQALPSAFVPLLVCLALTSLVWPANTLLLGGFSLAYSAILFAAAVLAAGRQRRWSLVWPIMAAFAIVHGSWSTGFATNLASFGHWPVWSRQSQAPATGGQR